MVLMVLTSVTQQFPQAEYNRRSLGALEMHLWFNFRELSKRKGMP